jgi:hypothetical protein
MRSSVVKIAQEWVGVRVHVMWKLGKKTPRPQAEQAAAQAMGVSQESTETRLKKYNAKLACLAKVNDWRRRVEAARDRLVYGENMDMRFIKRADLPAFEAVMVGLLAELGPLAAEVQAHRQEIVDDARQRLNGEYNPADYPADLASLFGLGWEYPAVDYVDDRLPAEVQERQREQIDQGVAADAERQELALLEELQDCVASLRDRLQASAVSQDGDKGWNEKTLNKIRGLEGRVRALSLLQTPFLIQTTEEAVQLLAGKSAQKLKAHPGMADRLAKLLNVLVCKVKGVTCPPADPGVPTAPKPAPAASACQSLPAALQPDADHYGDSFGGVV